MIPDFNHSAGGSKKRSRPKPEPEKRRGTVDARRKISEGRKAVLTLPSSTYDQQRK